MGALFCRARQRSVLKIREQNQNISATLSSSSYVAYVVPVWHYARDVFSPEIFQGTQCIAAQTFSSVGEASRESLAPFLVVVYAISDNRPFAQARTFREAFLAELRALSLVAREDIGPGVLSVNTVKSRAATLKCVVCYRWQGTLNDYLRRYHKSLTLARVHDLASRVAELLGRLHSLGVSHGAYGFENVLYRTAPSSSWRLPDLCLVNFGDATSSCLGDPDFMQRGLFDVSHKDMLGTEKTLCLIIFQQICHTLRFAYSWDPPVATGSAESLSLHSEHRSCFRPTT